MSSERRNSKLLVVVVGTRALWIHTWPGFQQQLSDDPGHRAWPSPQPAFLAIGELFVHFLLTLDLCKAVDAGFQTEAQVTIKHARTRAHTQVTKHPYLGHRVSWSGARRGEQRMARG